MVKSFVGTSPVRNEFGIRMVNSFKVIISNKFQKHSKKYLPQFLQFQFKIGQGLKIYIFLLLTILTIPIDPDAHHWAMIYAIA